jgi:hypothetical protein
MQQIYRGAFSAGDPKQIKKAVTAGFSFPWIPEAEEEIRGAQARALRKTFSKNGALRLR